MGKRRCGYNQVIYNWPKTLRRKFRREKLINFYQKWLGFEQFYSHIKSLIKSDQNEYIQAKTFLAGLPKNNIQNNQINSANKKISIKDGDIRCDVPVWFGDIKKSKIKIVVVGLEPRHANDRFNIERIGKTVYATPFGIDRWNYNSTIPYTPQNRYFRVFEEFLNKKKYFHPFY